MALTTDCTGTYDYEASEAQSEFDYLMELNLDYTPEEMADKVIKLRAHWLKCLGADGYRDFSAAWNNLCTANNLPDMYLMI